MFLKKKSYNIHSSQFYPKHYLWLLFDGYIYCINDKVVLSIIFITDIHKFNMLFLNILSTRNLQYTCIKLDNVKGTYKREGVGCIQFFGDCC